MRLGSYRRVGRGVGAPPWAALLILLLVSAPLASALPEPDFDRPDTWFDDHVYHHHADLTTELRQLQEDHPHYVRMTSIGTSVRGRELWNVRITDPGQPAEGKVRIYIDGEHHGNEYLGGELCILLIRHLLEDQGDPMVQEVLRSSIVWVTPMLNPDGNTRDTRGNANGIDLNRHYPFAFSPGGSHGDAPAVEPEVAANVDFMASADLDLYITMHTGIVRLVHPWGYTYDPSPDQEMFQRLAEVSEAHGVTYGQASTVLYIVEGSSKDYAYGALGVPGFTYEVDNEQTNQISRREDIAGRLGDELALLMDMLLATGSLRADLNATGTSVDVESTADGGDVRFSVDLENTGWANATNATVTVEVREGGMLAATHSTVFQLTAGNSTSVDVMFSIEGEGEYQLRALVEYPRLEVGNATTESFVAWNGQVHVEPGLLAGGGATLLGLLLLLVAIGAAVALWAWRRGWRPGWALGRVRGLAFPASEGG